MFRPSSRLALCVLLLAPLVVSAQDQPPVEWPDLEPPAHITVVDGVAALEREGRSEAVVANMPLLEGDRLETAAGRVEIYFPDGSTLHLDEFGALDLLSGNLLRLLRGRVLVYAAGRQDTRPDFDFQVDTPAGSVRLLMPGQYRISLFSGPEVELAVVRGEAALATSRASSQARTGERVYAREDEAPSRPMAFNSARWDAFEQWSDRQRREALGADSAEYLPDEVDRYASQFDRHGSWRSLPEYGWVWYPRVDADWRPYYHGYWHPFESLGWFWIGYDSWGWPTHHYGRWGFDGGWYWIPHRRFGPGWVSWGVSAGHVSWCPLGWNHRPLVSLFADSHYYGGRLHDPWRAWTVIPRRAFGSRVRVSSVALVGSSLDVAARRSFIVQHASPPLASGAVPRPIGAAGRPPSGTGRAVPRPIGGGTAAGPPERGWRATPGGQAPASRDSAVGRSADIGDRRGTTAGRTTLGAPDPVGPPGDRAPAGARVRPGSDMPAPRAGSSATVETPRDRDRDRDYWSDRRGSGAGTDAAAGSAVRRAPGTAMTPRGEPTAPSSRPAPQARPRGGDATGAGASAAPAAPSRRAPDRVAPRAVPPAIRGGDAAAPRSAPPTASRRTPAWQGGSSPVGRLSPSMPRGSSPMARRDPSVSRAAPSPMRSAPSRQGGAYSVGRVAPSMPRSAPPVSRAAPSQMRSAPSRPSGGSSIGRAPSGSSRSGSPGRTSSGSSGGGAAGGRARPRNGRQ